MSQLERVYFINRKIKKNSFVTISEVTENFEVSERTVKRDIEYMRNRLNAEIEYSHSIRGYIYKNNFKFMENFDEKMVIFYSFIKSLSENLSYIPLLSENILQNISKVLDSEHKIIPDMIKYELNEFENIDFSFFKVIFESVINNKQLRIVYESSVGKKSKRDIEAVKLINYSGKWYLFAYCHKSQDLRMFLLSGISYITELEKDSEGNYDVDEINEEIDKGFGIYKSNTTNNVTIRFYDPVMHIVKTQIWHKNQARVFGEKDGVKYIELTIPVASYKEILGKVLRYGADAEVIAPIDFKEMWKDSIRKMYERINS